MTAVENIEPLENSYIPETVLDREDQKEQLKTALERTQHVHVHGPRGTGKTIVVKRQLEELSNTCYVSCQEQDTQYKVLKKLVNELTSKTVGSGHHTSELQRLLKDQIDVVETTAVLDDLDFLLLNDGDDLLYFLSRLKADLGLILVTANHRDLRDQLEERTFSTLQPRRIRFEPYTGEEIYEILADRARKSLKPRSLRREALRHIASSTQNLALALTWLQIAAKTAEDTVTKTLVKQIRQEASQFFIDDRLQSLSQHHRLLYQAIEELNEEQETVRTGAVYSQYKKLCQACNEDSLSNRRVSDFLKHLEQFNLISSEYYYGGKNGKTREIVVQRHNI